MPINDDMPEEDLSRGATVVTPLCADRKVFKRFTLKKKLGEGGSGQVWLAEDEVLAQKVALKFPPTRTFQDKRTIEFLKRETRRCQSLKNEYIVRINEFFQDEGLAAVAMEFVEGDTLHGLLTKQPHGVFEVDDQFGKWVRQLCEALDYAHNRVKLVHHDIKPANLMVARNGDLRVADFGISRSIKDSHASITGEASSYTAHYASPQQLDGSMPSVSDDIYSVGATLYELLTSRPPFFQGDIAFQARKKVAPPMTHRRRELGILAESPIPAAWEETISSCLSKDPDGRPQSMMELAARLGLAPVAAAAPATQPAAAPATAPPKTGSGAAPATTSPPTSAPHRTAAPTTSPAPPNTTQRVAVVVAAVAFLATIGLLVMHLMSNKGGQGGEASVQPLNSVTQTQGTVRVVTASPAATNTAAALALNTEIKRLQAEAEKQRAEVEKQKADGQLAIEAARKEKEALEKLNAQLTSDLDKSKKGDAEAKNRIAAMEEEKKRIEEAKRKADEIAAREKKQREDAERMAADAKRKADEAERLRNARGAFSVATEPQGALIRLGNGLESRSPAVFRELPIGPTSFQVVLEGYESVTNRIEVRNQETNSAGTIRLIRSLGGLKLETIPSEMDYVVTGREPGAVPWRGRTPVRLPALPTGPYSIQFRRPGWPDASYEMKVLPNQEVPVSHVFSEGTLVVRTDPEGVEVLRDGKTVGKSTVKLVLPPGEVELTGRIEGLDPVRRRFNVLKDHEESVTLHVPHGIVRVDGEPAGAEVWLGENRLGIAPLELIVKPVSITFSVRMSGYEPGAVASDVSDGKKVSLAYALKRPGAMAKAASPTAPPGKAQTAAVSPGKSPAPTPPPGRTPAPNPASGQVLPATTKSPPVQVARAQPTVAAPIVSPSAGVGPLGGTAWTNSLGMVFSLVSPAQVYFSIWMTRVQDFEVFVKDRKYDATGGMVSIDASGSQRMRGVTWQNPGFDQSPLHPVCGVSWVDATNFCRWLTDSEIASSRLARGQYYRLPTDWEWSVAAGLTEPRGASPNSLHMKERSKYPWGGAWPPPKGSANIADESSGLGGRVRGYNDSFARTSPVGSFQPNQAGLFDMSGNVLEWCDDWLEPGVQKKVLRGASWFSDTQRDLLSSFRHPEHKDTRDGRIGFRVVIAGELPKP
jgi:serine/threonine protein kinase